MLSGSYDARTFNLGTALVAATTVDTVAPMRGNHFLGKAISSRGDMPKHRVPLLSREDAACRRSIASRVKSRAACRHAKGAGNYRRQKRMRCCDGFAA